MAIALPRPSSQMVTGGAIGIGVVLGVLLIGSMLGGGKEVQLTKASAVLAMAANDPVKRMARSWNDVTLLQKNRRLPVIGKDGARVFDLFHRPADIPPVLAGEAPKPLVGLMVLGLGYNRKATEAALAALPFDAGIAIAPGAPYRDEVLGASRASGREIWLHAPSESEDVNIDEGEASLMVNTPVTLNLDRLHAAMGGLTHYAGVALSPQSRLIGETDDFEPIMTEIGARGLGFAKLSPSPSLAVDQIAARHNVPMLPFAINLSENPAAVQQRLSDVLQIAREGGYAIAVMTEPNPVILQQVIAWVEAQRNNSFVLVPPSAIALEAAKPRAAPGTLLQPAEALPAVVAEPKPLPAQ